ncbi:hypothetical protein [Dactylosporangium sp. CA-092794]|uniref:hypothetical protein n=1 Tax=Dactylosporangium sp. CA-092794 TaxID=3239929 RepID=UPI003D8C69EB
MARRIGRGPGWAAPPPKPVRYPLHQRLADAWHGWRDGRRGIPLVPAALLDPDGHDPDGDDGEERRRLVGTPRLEALQRRSAELIHVERERYDRGLIGVAVPAEIEPRLDGLQAAVDRLEAQLELDRTPPDDLALKERRSAEGDHSDALVRTRRLAERSRREAGTARALGAAKQRRDDARQEMVRAAEDLRHTRRAAAARARRIHEHHWRRVAAYWQQLVRSHDKGPQLNALLRPVGPELPAWAEEED